MSTATQVAYLFTALCFILALKGLSSPKHARNGNLIGALGATIAVVVTVAQRHLGHRVPIIVAIVAGVIVAVPAARMVKMTAIPQMVAMFNGVGGGAAMLVALDEFLRLHKVDSTAAAIAVAFTAIVGSVSFTGSLITFAKLQELMTGRPILVPGARVVTPLVGLGAVGCGVAAIATASHASGSVTFLVICTVLALGLGVLFVLPVGGADVPVVISLLNACTGLAAAATGFELENNVLIVSGMLVGASGTFLTMMMGKAMNRSIANVIFGAFGQVTEAAAAIAAGGGGAVRSASAEDVAVMLAYAHKVVFVPGYGLAVAQAQHDVRQLADLLESKGVEVSYAIHPVAGRMPGHMNVLLAEANVPYPQLKEMDDANGEFPRTDVALVVGANDVVNPDARSNTSSPIYGMPILNVDDAQAVVVLKRSMNPGFAGIENPLFYNPKTVMLFGDAKASIVKLVQGVKAL